MTSTLLIEAYQSPVKVADHLKQHSHYYPKLVRKFKDNNVNQIITIARGSSDHAAAYLTYLAMMKMGIIATSMPMSIATLHHAQFNAKSVLAVAFSQSGQSPDLKCALEHFSSQGAQTLAFVNDIESPLSLSADHAVDLLAGAETSVAATKSFITQLVAGLSLVSHWTADANILSGLAVLPDALSSALQFDWSPAARRFQSAERMYVVSRGLGMSTALEAALKLKEICGIQAEAFSNAEIKHGPMALIGSNSHLLVFATSGPELPGLLDFAKQMRERGANVVVAGPPESPHIDLPVFQTRFSEFDPITAIQSFYPMVEALARLRGLDPDKPPYLSKVTQTH